MSKMSNWLGSLSDDDRDYALKHLPSHMAEAGDGKKLFRFLTDFDFIAAKIFHSELQSQDVIEDYDRVFEPKVSISGEKESTLKLIQGAIRLSANVVDQDKTQLAGQLLGRLMSFEVPEIQAMLEVAKQWKAAPWLRPLIPSFIPPGGPLLRTLTGHTGLVNSVAATPDGKRVISGAEDYTLKVWDLETGRELFSLNGHTGIVQAVAVTPDGKWVISGSVDETLKIWDLETKKEVFTLKGHSRSVESLVVTPDGKQIISGSYDGTLKVWSLKARKKIFTLKSETRLLEPVAVTPNGKGLISGSLDNNLKVWNIKKVGNIKSAKELFTLKGHTGSVESVVVTPDSNQLISASWDNTIKIWNLESGEELFTLEGHTGFVNAVAATPDGKQVISASNDKTLKVWDLESREVIVSFRADGELLACAVSPDGVTIVAGEASGRVHFLRLEGV